MDMRCRITSGGRNRAQAWRISGTVPQKANRPPKPARAKAGKGETVRQERTALPATEAARQTPPGARPNRDGARRKLRDLCLGPVVQVGCWRRRVTGVTEEWPSRGGNAALQNPAYRPADMLRGLGANSAGPPPFRRMIPKKPVPDLIRDGHRFSEKIMRHQQVRSASRHRPARRRNISARLDHSLRASS